MKRGGLEDKLKQFADAIGKAGGQAGLPRTGRTATLYPAAINTELLGSISHQASADTVRKPYARYGISPDRITGVVEFALDLPEETTVNEFTVGPVNQPW